MEKSEAIARINAIDESSNPLLKDVATLILNLDLELIACREEIRRDGELIGEIDALFAVPEAEKVLLIEVSTRTSNISEKISNFFSKWACQDNEILVRNKFTIGQTVEIIRIFFELSGTKNVPASVSHFTSEQGNHIFLEYDMKYFTDAFAKIGKWSKNDLLSFLKIRPRQERTIAREGFQFYLGSIRAYAYIDRVDQLLRYCYIFRRIKDDKGYQRVLEKGRIGNIALKIQSSNFLAFPNAILISCPDGIDLCDSPKERADCPALVRLRIPDYYCACRVIDGQHRLLGFSNLVKSIQENHFLPVIALENIG